MYLIPEHILFLIIFNSVVVGCVMGFPVWNILINKLTVKPSTTTYMATRVNK